MLLSLPGMSDHCHRHCRRQFIAKISSKEMPTKNCAQSVFGVKVKQGFHTHTNTTKVRSNSAACRSQLACTKKGKHSCHAQTGINASMSSIFSHAMGNYMKRVLPGHTADCTNFQQQSGTKQWMSVPHTWNVICYFA